MGKKIPILVDQCVQDEIRIVIEQCSGGTSALEFIDKSHELDGALDEVIVPWAKNKGRIIVTVEGGINEHFYSFREHVGIIVLAASHDSKKMEVFKRFMQSGERGKSHNAVTYLTEGKCRRIRLNDNGLLITEYFVV